MLKDIVTRPKENFCLLNCIFLICYNKKNPKKTSKKKKKVQISQV